MNEKYKKTCKYLNYVENLLILVSFQVLVGILITSSAVGLNICEIITGIKKYKSIIKKKKKKHNKNKLNTIKVLISKDFIDSYISHDEFVLVNDVLIEYNEMKKEIKSPENG